ncbi:MAG: flagellar hook protein FlgE [Candidatus Kapaibacterium sp.]|jgi:flagellar hook protein FlgE
MALIRSLTTGSTSLRAHQQRLDVISNNIANVNTVGYKSSQSQFVDQLSQVMSLGSAPTSIAMGGIGGVDPEQIGLGVRLGAIRSDFSQGNIRTTNRALDVAINGDAFFALSLNGSASYTRAGSFSLDKDGNLVDSVSGAFVQGYNNKLDANGRILKDSTGTAILDKSLASLRIDPNVKSSPKQSTQAMMAGNLSASLQSGESVQSAIPVYDNLGISHVLELKFTRTANANEYSLTGTIDGKALTLPAAAGTVTFKTDGTIDTPLNFDISAADMNTALGAGVTSFDTTKNLNIVLAEPNRILNGITQFAGQNSLNLVSQNGYAAGNLTGLTIDPTGKILGAFTNSQSEVLGQIAVARFTNPSGLLKQGDNLFSVSANSGLPNIGTAAEIFTSVKMIGGALEDSNVDLTEQFTDLISTQRGFEAAARTITISDQFLQEINQLKR